MIMPNSLSAYSSKMSGAELKETVKNFVEGYEGGFIPFNRGSLPVFSGISVEIKETDDGYTLSNVTMDGKKVQNNDTFTVTCLAIPKHMEAYPTDENIVFDGEMCIRDSDYIDGITLVNDGKVHLRPLISKTFAFKDYLKAYQYIDDNRETTMKVIINVQEK